MTKEVMDILMHLDEKTSLQLEALAELRGQSIDAFALAVLRKLPF